MFVPLLAERDGHDFIESAVAAGAAAHLTSRPLSGPESSSSSTAIAVADTADALRALCYNEFLAIQEDILLRVAELVEQAGTGFAFPSSTLYYTRDRGLSAERQQAAEKQVREWAAAQALPFPDFTEQHRKQISDTLDYPPEGSPDADRG